MWNQMDYSHDMDGVFGGWWTMFSFHSLLWLALLLFIGVFVIALYRDGSHEDDSHHPSNDTPRHGGGHS